MRKPQLVFIIALAGGLAACGETSSLQVSDGTGPSPKLPEPNKTLIPTVNIAPAIGWPQVQNLSPLRGLRWRRLPKASIIRAGSTCCPMATCWWPKPMRHLNLTTAKAFAAGSWAKSWAAPVPASQPEPHHPAAGQGPRRRRRNPHGVPGKPQLALRHDPGRQ